MSFILQVIDKMGNQQSIPQPQPIPPAPPQQAPPPPIPPVCDSDCQRQKQLDGLKLTLDQKEATQDTDPEGYEQARIAYYTALYGQGWLADEKNRIASDEIEPVLAQYTTQFNDLKNQLKTNKTFSNLASALESEQKEDEEDLRFLKKQFSKERDQVDVLNRLTTISSNPAPVTIVSTLVDLIIVILALFVIYLIYSKFSVIKGYFGFGQPIMPVGGKRLPK